MTGTRVSRHHTELAWGVLVVAIASVYLWQATRIPTSLLDDSVGPRGVPVLLGMAVLALGILQLVRLVASRRVDDGGSGPTQPAASADTRRLAPVVTLLLGVGYGLVLPLVGYAASIFLLLSTMSAYHGDGPSVRGAVVAIVGAAAFWGLFVWLLGIPQPAGFWAAVR